jgi:sigma-B regulation protein RsbU (phosphoserine phosphatase)
MWLLLRRANKLRRRMDVLLREKDVAYSFVQDVGEVFAESKKVVDMNRLLERVLYYAQRTSRAGAGALYLADPASGDLRAHAVSGMFPPIVGGLVGDIGKAESKLRFVDRLVRNQVALPGKGLIGRVGAMGRSILIANAELDSRVPRFEQEFLQIHSLLIVSMRFRDQVLGVIAVINRVDGLPFTETDQDLLQALADQASVSIYYSRQSANLEEKSRIDRDLAIAREIQGALLPGEIPQMRGIDAAGFNLQAQIIGGDYYDFIPLDETHMGVVIADVSGKGISGAIVIAICRTILRTWAPGDLSPAAVLKIANAAICDDLSEDLFVSILYMVVDTVSREVTVARAGHPRPAVFGVDGKEPWTINSAGMAIGISDSAGFDEAITEQTVVLKQGDTVLAYTDGVTDAKNREDVEWGLQNLMETAKAAIAESAGAGKTVDTIRQELQDFVGGATLYDDATLVAFRLM